MDRLYWEDKIKEIISSYDNSVDVEVGPVYDLVIRPVGMLLEEVSSKIEYVLKVTDIRRWSEWDDVDVDKWAGNYGVVRREGTRANGVVSFYSVRKPEGGIIIPRGVVVSTVDGVRFRTVERVEISDSEVENYRNSVTNRYEFDVRVEAVEMGVRGNVSRGSVVMMEGGVLKIDGVINKDNIRGGSDRESNDDLVKRVMGLVRGGWSEVSVEGLRHSVLMNFDVSDVYVEKKKPVLFGTVDLYFKGIEEVVVNDEVHYYYGFDMVLNERPVVRVNSVVSGLNVFVEGVDWKFVKDVDGSRRGSVMSRDKIVWIEGGNKPAYGSEVRVNYVYNRLVRKVEDWLSEGMRRFVDPVVVVREGKEVPIEIEMAISVYKGYDKSRMVEMMRDFLYQYLNNTALGEAVEVSDLHSVLRNRIRGVDNIEFTKLCRKGEGGVGDVILESMEYVSIRREDIVIY